MTGRLSLRLRRVILALLPLAVTAGGCARTPARQLDRWTLSTAPDAPTIVVQLPCRLDRTAVPSSVATFSLTTRVELPPAERGSALQLIVPDLATTPLLSVDGAPLLEPRESPSGYRSRGPYTWTIPAAATAHGVVELRLEIANRWTQSSWLTTVPRLVPAGVRDPSERVMMVINVLFSACALVALFQLALTSLAVFLVDRRRLPYLFFAIQAMTATIYPLYVIGFSQQLFGTADTAVLAGALIVAIAVSIYFTHGFFDLPAPPRFWAIGAVICCLVCVVFHGPFTATRVLGPVVVVYLTAAITCQVVRYTMLVMRHADRIGAIFMLIAWIGLAVAAAPDMLAWLGLADPLHGARTGSAGLALYPLWQSLLLSRRHITSLHRADMLNAELVGRVQQLERRREEIEQLNGELRHQVAERSSQIFAALALAGQGRELAPTLEPDTLIQQRYRVLGTLGAGGMGAVYEVQRVSDGRRLALKLAREVSGAALARLAREAQVACRVTHPNVVAVVDVDVASAGFLYIVMELVEGQPLSGFRDRAGEIDWALPILAQIADGLTALHEAEVVHRDLKPANVLLTQGRDGRPFVKISDFGISLHTGHSQPMPRVDLPDEHDTRKLGVGAPRTTPSAVLPSLDESTQSTLHVFIPGSKGKGETTDRARDKANGDRSTTDRAATPALTRTGMLPGTPAYIAPELVNGRQHVAPPADIFAFGVIAYELLTSQRPFDEPPALALLIDKQPQAARPLAELCPRLSSQLAQMIDEALAFDPARRPTAAALARIIHACAAQPFRLQTDGERAHDDQNQGSS